ncbi:hypothetical protein LPJ78_003231 [Coemansia sp. RSA 989]|nr:hypothetical protein LPJ68_004542 [Coemansia sp. RSA 1086]KAJ1753139.1 hypothetical protein LPJ79_000592 [Coemansia sp. RSA 1821]KAJ1864661.1 hypothetical protein LPJ78_003231 [Coemansia sp. RSA 989]KAJ1873542.1 hypothetical protein LPJ55_002203 [Coemansia sp. RSA 990]KAJ2674696.1 hypothetical protein IWW42_001542 [Coemansia sp. RSA 1085]
MAPRKGASRRANGGKKAIRKANAKATSSEGSCDDVPQTPRAPVSLKSPHRPTNTPQAGGFKETRQIFTPLFGRKYTKSTIDLQHTPQRTPANDFMRVAVSRTPYTAKRAISEYKEARDPIRTYVRLKPADPSLFSDSLPKSLLQVVSDKEVEINKGLADPSLCERYLFAGVLPTLAKQPRVFEVCAMPVVKDLFMGFNTLLFTYGITNSGKTFTVQGNSAVPGLLPRSIKGILDTLDRHQVQGDFSVRTKYATQVEYCSDPRVTNPTFKRAPGEDAWLAGLEQMEQVDMADIAEELEQENGEWVYQLYVSYFEVYNEMIYDLLDLSTLTTVQVKAEEAQPRTRTRGKRGQGRKKREDPDDPTSMSAAQIAGLPRTALLLRSEGGRGSEAFVDGVTEVRVRSVRDMVRVLQHGQMRRAVHATGLNSGSSRSHALFQAKLIKIRKDASIVPLNAVPKEAQASIRTLTIVDLAGSERAKRTHNQGERLAEAGKINVSLMTLKKCLDVKRYNSGLDSDGPQQQQLVPYNESKVTRLFQPALEGGAKTVMVVCIDPYEHALDSDSQTTLNQHSQALAETKNVLDFARVASSLVTRVRHADDPIAEPVVMDGQESPTMQGPRNGLMVRDADESEDEIFFDTGLARMTGGRKRTSSLAQMADKGTQTDEAVVGGTKRQRRDLGGDWQHPSPAQPPPAQLPTAKPSRHRSAQHDLHVQPTDSKEPTEWQAIAQNSQFSFEVAANQTAPLQLTQGLTKGSEKKLREALNAAQAQLHEEQQARSREVDELASYAEALETMANELRSKNAKLQEQVVRVEEETRAEAAEFFVSKIEQLQQQAGERLQDELQLAEQKAAHKLDILSRLRLLRGNESDEDSDEAINAAEVPTVSPRTAVRRAVSRAASKKANKMGSVSAGEGRELMTLRLKLESQEAQISSQNTQLEMVAQARAADRSRIESLEHALVEANSRAATHEARLMRLTSAHSADAELAATRVHEQERAALLAQITMLKQQLRDSETHSLRARRQWETQELLPVQERLRMMVDSVNQTKSTDVSAAEALERAERDRDNAWAWWTREQERSSQLCAQNDVLMREIRHLRAQVQQQQEQERPASPHISVHSECLSDTDESFCNVTIDPAQAQSAANGGNPPALAVGSRSQLSINGNRHMNALDRVISRGGRVLHRNPTAKNLASARESTESVAPSSLISPTSESSKREGRAKRVVSRVLNLTPSSKRNEAVRPYMAGRFANTDSAVGSYSAEVFSFQNGANGAAAGFESRARGNTIESVDSSMGDSRQHKVRSIVYSGPIVAHKTGGVSVTFTSQEVHDLPLGAEPIMEQSEEDDIEQPKQEASLPKQDEDVEMANSDDDNGDDEASGDEDNEQIGSLDPGLMEIPSMASLQSTVKKKRKLHAARTIHDIGSPENELDDRLVGAPSKSTVESQKEPGLTPAAMGSRASKAAEPHESKHPVLFTPVRTRSRGKLNESMEDLDEQNVKDSIFTTPMKMLSRLRHRKK